VTRPPISTIWQLRVWRATILLDLCCRVAARLAQPDVESPRNCSSIRNKGLV
jgi:hypothetical protein